LILEITGLDALHAELVGISFFLEEGEKVLRTLSEEMELKPALAEKIYTFRKRNRKWTNLKYDLKKCC
jgi:DNA polymerase-1